MISSPLDDEFVNYDSDYEIRDDTPNAQVDIDPYAGSPFRVRSVQSAETHPQGILFSKDRREEVIEVEEEPEIVHIPGVNERVKLMTQNQWMKGCPEGGEQGFLFSLYSQLIEGKCACPSGCGYSITRTKSHFFAIFVSSSPFFSPNQLILRPVLFRGIYRSLAWHRPPEVREMSQEVLPCVWRTTHLFGEGFRICERFE